MHTAMIFVGLCILNNIVGFKENKPIIKVANSFSHVFNWVPEDDWDYKLSLKKIEEEIKTIAKVSDGAISNSRGQWFEWMVSIDAFNHWVMNDHSLLILNLPNITRFDSASLYKSEIFGFVKDLRNKLEESLDIHLITSNPDFVLIDTRGLGDKFNKKPFKTIDKYNLDDLDSLYRHIINLCEFDDIVGYLSLKTSLRPDRRLQIAHEGSLTKATYVHLQTRNWIMEPRGIKYFGAALALAPADIKGLKTIATHSITTVMSKPEKAVDEVFRIENRQDLYFAINQMIDIIKF